MICPNCYKDVEDYQFCPHCGYRLEKCPKCGKFVLNDATYCSYCGHELKTQAQETEYAYGYIPLEKKEVKRKKKESYVPYEGEYQTIKESSKVNVKLILGLVLILAIVTGGSALYIANVPKNPFVQDTPTTINPNKDANKATSYGGVMTHATKASNINNGGIAAGDGQYLYVINGNQIIKMDKNYANQKAIVTGVTGCLQVANKKLYYTDDHNYLCSIDLDGNNPETIINKEVYYVNVDRNMVYFQLDSEKPEVKSQDECIYSYDMNTKKYTKINKSHSYYLSTTNTDLYYYSNNEGINQYNLQSKKETLLSKGTFVNVVVSNTQLFYTRSIQKNDSTDYQLCTYDLKTNQETIITEGYFLNMNSQYLFYYDLNHHSIAGYNLNTKQSTLLNVSATKLTIVEDVCIVELSNDTNTTVTVFTLKNTENLKSLFDANSDKFV